MTAQDFPSLPVRSGDYASEWYVAGEAVAGSCRLEPLRPASATVYTSFDPSTSSTRHYPRNSLLDALAGVLRTGQDVLLGDCHVSIWPSSLATEESRISARWALAGVGIHEISDPRFDEARLQITGLDGFFLTNPVKDYTWPKQLMSESDDGSDERYVGRLNPDRTRVWEEDDVKVTCTYDQTMALSGYELRVAFAPVVSFEVAAPMTVDEWIEHWIQPLLRLVTFATRTKQDLSWVTLHRKVPDPHHPEGERTIRAQLFGGGIKQLPYTAERPLYSDNTRFPLISLPTLEEPLPKVIRRWRELDGEGPNPFVELYRLVLFAPELPERARFLYLTQALEALHLTENTKAEESREASHLQERDVALLAIVESDVGDSVKRFIRKHLSKKPWSSLEARLDALVSDCEGCIDIQIDELLASEIGQDLSRRDIKTLPDMVRQIRNDLSHGSQNYDSYDLRAWNDALAVVADWHLKRLLLG